MKNISKIILPLMICSTVMANNELDKDLIQKHDQAVRSKLEQLNNPSDVTDFKEIFNFEGNQSQSIVLKYSSSNKLKEQLDFFFENKLLSICEKYKVSSSDLRSVSENLVDNSLTLKQSLKILASSLEVKGLENSNAFTYEVLYELNLYLKFVAGSMFIEDNKLDLILKETYFVANELREIVFSNNEIVKTPSLAQLSSYENKSTLVSNIELLNHYELLSEDINQTNIYLGPKIYIVDKNELNIVTENITQHPLSLIYAPGKKVSIKALDKDLTVNSLSLLTSGLKSLKSNKLEDDYLNNFLANLETPKNYVSLKINLDNYFTNGGVRLEKKGPYVYGSSLSNDAQNGGKVMIDASLILGINHIDASGANGRDGNDSKGSLAQIDGKLYKLDQLDNVNKPSYPTNGQHGGHGGDIRFTSSNQFSVIKNFVSHCRSDFGLGGKAGKLKGNFDSTFKNMNEFSSYDGLSGHSGNVENFIIME